MTIKLRFCSILYNCVCKLEYLWCDVYVDLLGFGEFLMVAGDDLSLVPDVLTLTDVFLNTRVVVRWKEGAVSVWHHLTLEIST